MTKRRNKRKKKSTPRPRPVSPIGAPAPAGTPPVRMPNPDVVKFMQEHGKELTKSPAPPQQKLLTPRPFGSPSIFEETTERPVRIIIQQMQAPGDILMLTAALRDLHKAYPQQFLTDVRTSANEFFENNPYITKLNPRDPRVYTMKAEYPLISHSNKGPWHFVEAFHDYFASVLGIPVKPTLMRGDVYVSDEEKGWFSQIREIVGQDIPYWIIDAGYKNDYTCKMWEFARYQAVIDAFPQITWVQIGAKDTGHTHQELQGDNVINLVGKTNLRQLVRLMYHAVGVISPVSLPMHLCAAVEMKGAFNRMNRPCIVLAGGREPNQWEQYVNHQYLHTCGQLHCCDDGGCWLSRIEKLNDKEEHNEKICTRPIKSLSGQMIPQCMDMIKVDEVIMHVDRYMSPEPWNYYEDWNKHGESEDTGGDRGGADSAVQAAAGGQAEGGGAEPPSDIETALGSAEEPGAG